MSLKLFPVESLERANTVSKIPNPTCCYTLGRTPRFRIANDYY